MSGFLDQMAAGSRQRVADALAREPLAAIERRARESAMPPALQLDGRFDLIAELKLRSPALGRLGATTDDLTARVRTYAEAGSAAVSVLTEPGRFDGSLEHLRAAAAALAPLGVPAMRKDFLVDPYQLFEARAAGAGGALLIVRMLSRDTLDEMLDCAAALGLFVLLEAFDEADIAVAAQLGAVRRRSVRAAGTEQRPTPPLIGVNSRDLQTLEVVPARLTTLAALLPADRPRVAESGIEDPADVERVARAGYDMALVGGALMKASDPGALVRAMLVAGRAVAA